MSTLFYSEKNQILNYTAVGFRFTDDTKNEVARVVLFSKIANSLKKKKNQLFALKRLELLHQLYFIDP